MDDALTLKIVVKLRTLQFPSIRQYPAEMRIRFIRRLVYMALKNNLKLSEFKRNTLDSIFMALRKYDEVKVALHEKVYYLFELLVVVGMNHYIRDVDCYSWEAYASARTRNS